LKNILIYHLFTAIREEKRLVTPGTGDYLLLLELLEKGHGMSPLAHFDDFVFICEKVWLKNKAEQQPFREIFEKWRQEIERYVLNQYQAMEKAGNSARLITNADTAASGENDNGASAPNMAGKSTDNFKENFQPGKDVQANPNNKATVAEQVLETADETEGALSFSIGAEKQPGATTSKSLSPNLPVVPVASSKTFLFGNEYFPVANRYLQQNWRNLRSSQEVNEFKGINFSKTIEGIARKGYFTAFEYNHKRANLISLFIFIDQGGSMDACEAFGKELALSAQQSEVHTLTTPYYFYNLPVKKRQGDGADYLLSNEDKTGTYSAASLFGKLNRKNTVLLIYSDAGAFRGTMDETTTQRVNDTREFLRFLLKKTAQVAWLNPAPKHRWTNTAATAISTAFVEVPMFEASDTGIAQAVNALKGKMVIYH